MDAEQVLETVSNSDVGIRLKELPPLHPKTLLEIKKPMASVSSPVTVSAQQGSVSPTGVAMPAASKFDLKLTKQASFKSSYFYKTLLFFLAGVIVLYMTKKYWWNFLVKRFFPTDAKPHGDFDPMGGVGGFKVQESDGLIDVVEKDAADVLKPAPFAKVVLIYATWCHHCESMMPAFEEAARTVAENLKKDPSAQKVLFLRAEANAAPTLSNRPSVPGFPTIVGVFQNGKEFPYDGPRNAESFVKFAELIAVGGLPSPDNAPPVIKPRKFVKSVPVESPTFEEKETEVSSESVSSEVDEKLDEEEETVKELSSEDKKDTPTPSDKVTDETESKTLPTMETEQPSVKTRKSKKELKL